MAWIIGSIISVLGTGISYFASTDGTEYNDTPFPNANNYDRRYIFSHFMMPVNFGYHVPMGNRFFAIPMIQPGLSYNTSKLQTGKVSEQV